MRPAIQRYRRKSSAFATCSAIALVNRSWSRAAGLASALAAGDSVAVLGGLLLLSALPVSGLADVVGWPGYGLAATAGAAFVMGGLGIGVVETPHSRS